MYKWHHIASDSNIMTQISIKRLLETWLIQFEFQIPRHSTQSIKTPIIRVNRMSRDITQVKLLSVSKIVAVLCRVTFPKAQYLPKLMKAKHYK
jgi:uncharacterized SAM-binding protein YcdF (DUF218 family)